MKTSLIAVTTLALLGCHSSIAAAPNPERTMQSTEIAAAETSYYVSEQFNIAFNYPTGYAVATDEGRVADGVIALFQAEDVGMPEAPYVYIGFFENSEQLSLQTFRDDVLNMRVIQEYADTTVAGQPALDFDSTGYYESRNQFFRSPDGRYIVYFSASYIGGSASEPFLDAAKVIQNSWIWR